MPRVFVSYGHTDGHAVAERVRSQLTENGHQVWQDAERIRTGWSWTDEIRDGLRNSQILVALLSPHSVRQVGDAPDGKDSVCLQEITYAVDACRIPVVPVMVFDCEPPFRIFDLQFLDFRIWGESDASDEKLLRKLSAAVEEAMKTGHSKRRDWGWQSKPWNFGPFLSEKRERFTGRDWFFSRIQGWLAKEEQPALLITGGPGVGKSAIVAELIHRNRDGQVLAYHCCQADTPATLEPGRFVRSLSGMLSARIEPYAAMLQDRELREALSEAAAARDPAAAFEAGVLAPLADLPAPREGARYILVDALDESLTLGSKPTIVDVLATRLRRLPKWLKVVATTRPEQGVLNKLRGLRALQISAEDPENRRDVRAFLDVALASSELRESVALEERNLPDLRDGLLEASQFNFLFVKTALDAIAGGQVTFEQVLALPPNLSSLYQIFFERIYGVDKADYADARRVLQAIVAAQQSPSRAELGRVTGLDDEEKLPQILGALSSFVYAREGRYAVFHRSLYEWLTTLEDDQPVAGPYYASLVSGHRLWADSCLAEYARCEGAPRGYALAFLCTHLAGARRWDELVEALSDWRFLEAKVATEGSNVFELQADFRLVLARLPGEEPRARNLALLAEVLRLDAEFINQHPNTLFQCCWNRGWWYDTPEAAYFWELGEGEEDGAKAPWQRKEGKLCKLLENWRAEKEASQPGFLWLRAARPMAERLGGAQLAVLRTEGDLAGKVAVSPDSSRVLMANIEDEPFFVKLWDTETGAPAGERDLGDAMLCGAKYSPDGGTIAVGLETELLLLESDTLEQIATVELPDMDTSVISYSPDGRLVAIGNGDGGVGIVDIATRKLREIAEAHSGRVQAIAFSHDGRYLASGSQSFGGKNTVVLWRYHDGLENVKEIEAKSWVESIIFSPDGRKLVWGDYDGNIEFHDLETGENSLLREPHGRPVAALAFLPDGLRLLCGGGGTEGRAPISIMNIPTGALERVLWGHMFGISDLSVYREGRALASAGDATVRLWSLEHADDSSELTSLEPDVSCTLFARKREVLYSAHKESEFVWCRALDDGEPLMRLAGHVGGVRALAQSPDGTRLACATGDGAVRIWDAVTGEPLHVCEFHTGIVADVAFSANGSRLASGGRDGMVRIVDVATGELISTFDGHGQDWVQHVAFSPDGRLVASIALDSTRVWDTYTEADHLILAIRKNEPLYAPCFTPDSRVLIAQAPSRLIAWDVTSGGEIAATIEHWEVFRLSRGEPLGPWGWKGERRGPEPVPPEQQYMTLISLQRNEPVAWLPIVGGGIIGAPSGRIWINQRGTQLWVFQLEGAP